MIVSPNRCGNIFSERKPNEKQCNEIGSDNNYNVAVWSDLWVNPEDAYSVTLNRKTNCPTTKNTQIN
jgi:hypothetical protein